MSVLDKLAFWKKKDDFDLGKDFGGDLGLGPAPGGPDLGLPPQQGMGQDLGLPPQQGMGNDLGLPSKDMGMPGEQGFDENRFKPPQSPPGQQIPMQQPFGAPVQPQAPTERDYKNDKFEVVSAKLDSIRYTLESINQRLTNLERIAHGDHEKKKGW